jgi:carbohydrate kinase (thermoresistant glucokinase family)
MGTPHKIYYIMGVSGCGKTTLGKKLAAYLGIPFFDGDDYHPPENIRKMTRGIPLKDEDRQEWLRRLNDLARSQRHSGAVIACSALKEAYRKVLGEGLQGQVCWVFLQGSYQEIHDRMTKRAGHFMPASLLQNQFDTLEPPRYGIHIPVSLSPEQAMAQIFRESGGRNPERNALP